LYRYDILALKRFPLGTPYAAIVEHVSEVMLRPELGTYPKLVIDATGVGRPIEEQFRTALAPHPRVEVHAATITAGRGHSIVRARAYHVAKIELIAAVREALELRRLKIVRFPDGSSIEFADVLKRELLNFRVRITASANETFAAREGQHDDLVLSVALVAWLAGQRWMEMVLDDEAQVPLRSKETAALREERDMLASLESADRKAIALEQAATKRQRISDWMDIDNPAWWS
jgi:hypothetical protein